MSKPIDIKKGFTDIDISFLVAAKWNYKTNNPDLSAKLRENIKRNGQIENLLVRRLDTGFYEVVNGNHRLEVMHELGMKRVFVFNLGDITDNAAKRISIETNETKFTTDNIRIAELFKEMQVDFTPDELATTMPFSTQEIENFNKLLDFDWSPTQTNDGGGDGGGKGITLNNDLTESITIVFGIEDEQIKADIKEFIKAYPTAKLK